jgi:hypothetical protein
MLGGAGRVAGWARGRGALPDERIAAEVDAWTPYRASKNGRGFAFRYLDDPLGVDAPSEFQIYRANGNQALVLPSCPAGRTLVVHMCPAEDIAAHRADPEGAWQAKLDQDPALRRRIGGATNMSKVRSTDDLSAYYRRSSGPRHRERHAGRVEIRAVAR